MLDGGLRFARLELDRIGAARGGLALGTLVVCCAIAKHLEAKIYATAPAIVNK